MLGVRVCVFFKTHTELLKKVQSHGQKNKQASLEAQSPQLLSKEDTFTVGPVKGKGSKGDTLMSHRSLLYRAQDST